MCVCVCVCVCVSGEVLVGTAIPEKGGLGWGGGGGGGGGTMHDQNDFCIKMGSDESRFNVSSVVRASKTVSTDHNF